MAAAVVPAAGRSERFGSMKLVALVDGERLLDRTLRSLIDAGAHPVIVVLAGDASLDSVTRLGHTSVRRVVNPDPSRGMFSSIQCGLALADSNTTLVLPADMPFITSETIRVVADASTTQDRVAIPTYRGRKGHPIGIPARLIAHVLGADPSRSLKDAIAARDEDPLLIEVDDEGVVRDVDRRADLHREI